MQRLIEGYSRFRTKVFPTHSQLFEKLAAGQKPQALFFACSDSRVMPEMMMQCDPGDLFHSEMREIWFLHQAIRQVVLQQRLSMRFACLSFRMP